MAGRRLNSIQEVADECSPKSDHEMKSENEIPSSTRSNKVGSIYSPQKIEEDIQAATNSSDIMISQNFTNSYLQALDKMTKASHIRLDTKHSQQLAKVHLIEAISGIRGTLPPLKQIGQDFGSGFKWSGGCRSPDGRIFFAPHGADHVWDYATLMMFFHTHDVLLHKITHGDRP